MTVVFELYSDLHIETRSPKTASSYPEAKHKGTILLLAGDIYPAGEELFEFIIRRLSNGNGFPLIIHVPGNHEYYETIAANPKTMQQINQKLQALTKSEQLPFVSLNPGIIDLHDNIRIIGCTMWTNIPKQLWNEATKSMNDYNYIFVKTNSGAKRRLLAEDVVRIHIQQKQWLIDALQDAEQHKKKVIVMTHHAPVTWLQDKNATHTKSENIPFYYSTDLEDIIKRYEKTIKLWCYGHTHKGKSVHAEIFYYNNGKGYPKQNTGYVIGNTFSLI